MPALGCHAGTSPLYKIPAKMTTRPTSLRKGEKGKFNLCKVVFSCLKFSNQIGAYAAYFCIGISREGKALPVVSQSQQHHPTSELAYGLSTVPSKYFYLRDITWEHLGAVTSRRIQFWVLKGFSKCVLHMLWLKLFATKLLHNSASCK